MKGTPVILAVAGTLLAGGLVGVGYADHENDGTIHVCVKRSNGKIKNRVERPRQCEDTQYAMTWNKEGPKGDRGKRGKRGKRGPEGPPGISDRERVLTIENTTSFAEDRHRVVVTCATGKVVLGGGGLVEKVTDTGTEAAPDEIVMKNSWPDAADTWIVVWENTGVTGHNVGDLRFTGYAICAKIAG